MREGERREENDKYMRHMLRMECKGKCEFVDCELCMVNEGCTQKDAKTQDREWGKRQERNQ